MTKSKSSAYLREFGRTVKLRDETYNIISCMMTGADSFNEVVEMLLSDHLKSNDEKVSTIQDVLKMNKIDINLRKWLTEYAKRHSS